MSDLKKWLETVSNESTEHSADIDAQPQLKEDEATSEVGDNEKLSDDPSRTDASATVKVEGSDTAVSIEDVVSDDAPVTATSVSDDDQAALAEPADVTPVPVDEPVVAEVETDVTDAGQTDAAEPVDINQPVETEIALEAETDVEAEVDPVVAETPVEVPTEEVVPEDVPAEAPEAAVDTAVDEVEDTVATEPVVEAPVADAVVEAVEPVDPPADGEEGPLLEVDPVAEIQEGAEPTPVEGPEEDESFEDFDAAADATIMDDMDGVEQDIDDMDNMSTALEAYGDLLAGEMDRKNGVVDPALVRAIQIGLESFGEPVLMANIPSLEDFADPSGRYVVSLEFAEGMKGKMDKIAQATAGALKRLWELLEDIFRQFKANVPALQQKNKEIEEKLKNTVDAGKGAVSMKGARRLYIGDMFAGNNPNNIREVYQVGDKFMVLYPKMFRSITEDYKALTQGLTSDTDDTQSIVAFMTAITKHLNPSDLGLQQINAAKAPNDMQKYAGIAASPTLLGNRRFFAGVNNVKIEANRQGTAINSDSSMNAMVYMADYFKLTFGKEQGVPDSGTDDTIKLPDVNALRQLASETATLTKHLEKYSEATSNFRQIRREMEQSTAKLHGLDKGFRYGQINSLGILAQGITRAITVPTGHFVGYVGNLVRVLQAFIEYCINEHQAAVTDV